MEEEKATGDPSQESQVPSEDSSNDSFLSILFMEDKDIEVMLTEGEEIPALQNEAIPCKENDLKTSELLPSSENEEKEPGLLGKNSQTSGNEAIPCKENDITTSELLPSSGNEKEEAGLLGINSQTSGNEDNQSVNLNSNPTQENASFPQDMFLLSQDQGSVAIPCKENDLKTSELSPSSENEEKEPGLLGKNSQTSGNEATPCKENDLKTSELLPSSGNEKEEAGLLGKNSQASGNEAIPCNEIDLTSSELLPSSENEEEEPGLLGKNSQSSGNEKVPEEEECSDISSVWPSFSESEEEESSNLKTNSPASPRLTIFDESANFGNTSGEAALINLIDDSSSESGQTSPLSFGKTDNSKAAIFRKIFKKIAVKEDAKIDEMRTDMEATSSSIQPKLKTQTGSDSSSDESKGKEDEEQGLIEENSQSPKCERADSIFNNSRSGTSPFSCETVAPWLDEDPLSLYLDDDELEEYLKNERSKLQKMTETGNSSGSSSDESGGKEEPRLFKKRFQTPIYKEMMEKCYSCSSSSDESGGKENEDPRQFKVVELHFLHKNTTRRESSSGSSTMSLPLSGNEDESTLSGTETPTSKKPSETNEGSSITEQSNGKEYEEPGMPEEIPLLPKCQQLSHKDHETCKRRYSNSPKSDEENEESNWKSSQGLKPQKITRRESCTGSSTVSLQLSGNDEEESTLSATETHASKTMDITETGNNSGSSSQEPNGKEDEEKGLLEKNSQSPKCEKPSEETCSRTSTELLLSKDDDDDDEEGTTPFGKNFQPIQGISAFCEKVESKNTEEPDLISPKSVEGEQEEDTSVQSPDSESLSLPWPSPEEDDLVDRICRGEAIEGVTGNYGVNEENERVFRYWNEPVLLPTPDGRTLLAMPYVLPH